MATSKEETAPPGKSKRKILVFGLLALALAGAGGGGYWFMKGNAAPAPAQVKVEAPIFFALEPFTVNLQPGGRNRFLHVAVTLKMADAKSQVQMTQYLPEVRSRVLSTLSNREAESLATPEDKARLSGEIILSLGKPFGPNTPQQKISSVMFTTFMLQ
ncbi:Flagellar biosynthesis protein FliL [Polaromonas sp. CG9_12]|uniref:flagellar basal body-associated protein FliL n=1 Tax=Polaromonas sp. CG_9.11 TaxID=2787730 RepID=UPI0004DDDD8B|nr:flagellar basal body-associated protein FliL [Polaromonas sp. CG_9.11]MBG6077606.1 flagellar FliL protein [Polaromonas sp. CG_9.11]CDS50340.1 Flagellar biosynthesis protein FliL [Polaromonas sp. CG9_12]